MKRWIEAQHKYDLSLALAAICSFQGRKALIEKVLEPLPYSGKWGTAKVAIQLNHLCQIGEALEWTPILRQPVKP